MKKVRLFLAVLISILIIPFASAELRLDSFSSVKYNLGDGVLVSGDVSYHSDTRAILNLNLNCDGKSSTINSILFNLKANKKEQFSRYVTLPVDMSGRCRINMQLSDLNGRLLESADFTAFELTKELTGTFELNSNRFQLGDRISINGFVNKQNSNPADGVLILTFKNNGTVYFTDTVQIDDGVFNYTKTLNKLIPGDYSLDIAVRDNLGNTLNSDNLFNIKIEGNLDIVANLDKNLYDPGDTLTLRGYVGSGSNKNFKDIDVEFDFFNEIITKNLADSGESFSVSYSIPSRIKTGKHDVKITSSDEEGNYGTNVINYNVRAIPTSLNIALLGSSAFDPGSKVDFRATLLDQAGDLMQDNVNVRLIDESGREADVKFVSSGVNNNLILSSKAKPGNWRLKAEGYDLNAESNFNVKEYKKLNTTLNGDKVKVENVGNVPYDGVFDILGNDEKKTVDLNLGVGESKDIKLGDLFPSGNYSIKLPFTDESFDNVQVTKTGIFSGLTGRVSFDVDDNVISPSRRILLFFALLIIGGSVIYLVLGKKRKISKREDFLDSKYLKHKRKLEKKAFEEKSQSKPSFGKATQEDIDYWKKKVQESFKGNDNVRETRNTRTTGSSDPDSGGSVFERFMG
ncbi:hypothetical protein J4216_03615 [Candidatus Woesearchaeota archaeon]|nr:hypothetical protein [Candidatus Woesearchaeota archaeon]